MKPESGVQRRRVLLLAAVVGVVALAAAAVGVIELLDDERQPGDVVLPTDLEDLGGPWRQVS